MAPQASKMISVALLAAQALPLASSTYTTLTERPIAIIGAGPAGLLTARELRKLGFENIEIFERGDKVCEFVNTIDIDGRKVETGTQAIPAHYYDPENLVSPVGMYPPMQALLDEFNISTYDGNDFDDAFTSLSGIYNLTTLGRETFPRGFANDPLQFISDFTNVLNASQEVFAASSVAEAAQLNVLGSYPGQTFEEWCNANNFPEFLNIWSQFADFIGDGPQRDVPISRFFMQLKHVYPSIFKTYLSAFGITAAAIPDTPENEYLRFVLSNTDRLFFVRPVGGYQNFVDRIAASLVADGVQIHLNSEVTAVRTKFGPEAVYVDGVEFGRYDAVIMTARPNVAKELLPWWHPAKYMFEIGAQTEMYNWMIFDHPNLDAAWPASFGDAGTLHLEVSAVNLGQSEFGDLPPCQPITFSRRIPTDTLQARSYRGADLSSEECKQLAIEAAAAYTPLNLTMDNFIDFGRHPYPVFVNAAAEANYFWEDFEFWAQGFGQIWFTGEMFVSQGVPLALDRAIHWTPQFANEFSLRYDGVEFSA